MSKHTPGPWVKSMSGTSVHVVMGPDKTWVAKCGFGMESEANARLIAAAPDLLEALQTIRGVIVMQRDLIEGGKHAEAWAHPLKVIDAAIAKAEGQ